MVLRAGELNEAVQRLQSCTVVRKLRVSACREPVASPPPCKPSPLGRSGPSTLLPDLARVVSLACRRARTRAGPERCSALRCDACLHSLLSAAKMPWLSADQRLFVFNASSRNPHQRIIIGRKRALIDVLSAYGRYVGR